MATSIDERVVSLKFDNAGFEENVSDSINSLNKLNSAIRGAEKGDIDLGKVNISPIEKACDTISNKFSNLGVVWDQTLRTITNNALHAAKELGEIFTIKFPKAGFQEYETQIGSTQTIMANTGRSIEDVTKALDDLNDYADKTIYDFTTMTRNAGLFTAAIGNQEDALEKSTKALKGIGNWAAFAGADATTMARVTYQLSQGAASGAIRLMDWRSIETAGGMSGAKYRQAFIDEAVKMGALKEGQVTIDNFRDTLKDGWLTADVFFATMSKFADDPAMTDAATKVKTFTQLIETLEEALGTGWATTFRTIIGNFEEARDLWTEISDHLSAIINNSSEARNALAQSWKDLGGRTALIEALWNGLSAIESILIPIKQAFSEVFPAPTAERLVEMTQALADFINEITLTKGEMEDLKRIFRGVFAVFDIGLQIFSAIARGIVSIFSPLHEARGSILDTAGSIGDFIYALDIWLKQNDVFGKAVEKVAGIIRDVLGGAIEFISSIWNSNEMTTFTGILQASFEAIASLIDKVVERFGLFTSTLDSAHPVLDFISTVFLGAIGAIGKGLQAAWTILSPMIDGIKNFFQNATFSDVLDILNILMSGGLIAALTKMTGLIDLPVFTIHGGITDILDTVGDSLEGFTNKIKTENLRSLAVSIAILAGSLLVLSLIDSEKLAGALTAVAGAMFIMVTAMKSLSQLTSTSTNGGLRGLFTGFVGTNSVRLIETSTAMVLMATSVLILAGAMKMVSDLDWGQVARGLVTIGGLLAELTVVSIVISKYSKKFMKGASGLILMAVAIRVLTDAFIPLSELSWEQIGKGLVAVGSLIAALGAFSVLTNGKGIGVFKGTGLILMAVAIKMLSDTLISVKDLNWEQIGKGLAVIAGSMVSIAAASALMPSFMVEKAVGIVIMAQALKLITDTIASTASISWETYGKGMAVFGGSLAIMVGGLIALGRLGRHNLIAAASIYIVAEALSLIGSAISSVSGLSWGEIGKGLATMGGGLAEVVASLAILGLIGPGVILGAASILMVASALSILSPIIKTFSGMSWDEIGRGLAAMGGGLAIIVAAGIASMFVVPGMLALSAALISLGAAALMIGGGLALAGVGLNLIATSLGILATISTAAAVEIVAAMSVIILGFLALVPSIASALALGIATFVQALAASAGTIAVAIVELVSVLLEECRKLIPQIVDVLLEIVDECLKSLAEHAPSIINSIIDLIINILEGIAERSNDLGTAIGDFISGLFDIMFEAFKVVIEDAAENIGEVFGAFIGGILNGIAKALDEFSLEDFGTELGNFMTNLQPFIDGAKDIDSNTLNSIRILADAIMAITAADVIQGMTSWITGGSSLTDFGKQLADFGPYMKSYSDSVAGLDSSLVTSSASAAAALAQFATNLPNEGGLVSLVTGDNDIVTFGEKLEEFAPLLMSYSEEITGFNSTDVTRSINAANMLAGFAETVGNSGGIVAAITGDNDIETFGTKLESFGPSLMAYAESITGIDSTAVQASVNAATMLTDFAKQIPNAGGLVSKVTGDNDIDTFGEKLETFGPAMAAYAESVAGIDSAAVTASASAAQMLVDLANNIPDSGGLLSWFSGDNAIDDFGTQLQTFGYAMVGYSDSIADMDVTKITSVTDAMKAILDLVTAMDSIDENAATKFNNVLIAISTTSIDEFVNVFSSEDTITDIKSAVDTMISDAADKLDSATNISKFITAGENFVDGFIQGITNKSSDAYATITALGETILANFKESLQEHSPSEATYEDAEDFADGWNNGIVDNRTLMIANAKKAAEDSVDAANDATKEGVDQITTTIEDGAVALSDTITTTQDQLLSQNTSFWDTYNSIQQEGLDASLDSTDKYNARQEKTQDEVNQERWESMTDYYKEAYDIQTNAEKEAEKSEKKSQERRVEWYDKYWQQLLDIQRKGVDASKYLSMSLADFEKNTFSSIQDLWKDFVDTLVSGTDDILGAFKLGAKFEIETDDKMTPDEFLENEKSQTEALIRYNDAMTAIHSTVENLPNVPEEIRKKMLEEIDSIDVDDVSLAETLAQMSPEQWEAWGTEEYNQWLLAQNAAFTKMEEEKATLDEEMQKLLPGVDWNMQDFAELYDGTFGSLSQYIQSKIDPEAFRQMWADAMIGGAEGLIDPEAIEVVKENALAAIGSVDNMDDPATVLGYIKTDLLQEHSPSLVTHGFGFDAALGLGEGLVDPLAMSMVMLKAEQMIRTVRDYLRDWVAPGGDPAAGPFHQIGVFIDKGVEAGINDGKSSVIDAAVAMAAEAYAAACLALGIQSPSKLFMGVGEYVSEGMAIGITNGTPYVVSSIQDTANTAFDTMANMIHSMENGEGIYMNLDPTITPILDLSNVRRNAEELSAMLYGKDVSMAGTISASRYEQEEERAKAYNDQNGGENAASTISFTQNNYSPKALSRLDIYRQTRNQIHQLKGVLS